MILPKRRPIWTLNSAQCTPQWCANNRKSFGNSIPPDFRPNKWKSKICFLNFSASSLISFRVNFPAELLSFWSSRFSNLQFSAYQIQVDLQFRPLSIYQWAMSKISTTWLSYGELGRLTRSVLGGKIDFPNRWRRKIKFIDALVIWMADWHGRVWISKRI